MNSINQFLESPTVKVELELTDKAQLRLIVVFVVTIVVALCASVIYKKVK